MDMDPPEDRSHHIGGRSNERPFFFSTPDDAEKGMGSLSNTTDQQFLIPKKERVANTKV